VNKFLVRHNNKARFLTRERLKIVAQKRWKRKTASIFIELVEDNV
jgi:hypothetical protein